MEGDREGEGIVAIVQGLRGAGLAVTLMGGRQRRRTAINQSKGVGRAKSTVDTNTGALPLSTSKDATAQICDDRYTSSYQMAHCHVRPSSPPVQLKEFPPQRLEPSRTQGNFEVGARETQSPTHSSVSRSQTFRNSYTSVDRSLLSNTRPSRCTESFAFSLRKYPSGSPNISSELVQRLLDYTQTKHFSKSSYHIKNTRLRRSRTESPKAIQIMKSSKAVQTYTRTSVREKVSKSVERGKENVKEDRKRRSQSPVMSLRGVRHKSKCIDASYDYLKSTSPRRFTTVAADVRYLTDVTRCLRDTLRQICDDQPVVCPNIQYRYSQHRRMHHRRASQDDAPDSNYCPGGSVRMVSIGIPAMSACEAMAGTFHPVCPSPPKVCCYCRKPVPCNCPRTFSSFDDYAKNVEEQVFKWLDELPVYANDTLKNRHIRKDMAKELAEQLKALKDDEDFEVKAKTKIYECINNMPMWLPGDKENQDLFKQLMANGLFDKINNISRNGHKFEKAIKRFIDNLDLKTTDSQGQGIDKQSVVDTFVNRLKTLALNQPADSEDYKGVLISEIVEIMKGLPINVDGDKDAYVHNHADKLATELHKIPVKDISKRSSAESLEDEFEKVIWKWVNDVPNFASDSASKIADNQKSVKTLANKLKRLQAQGIDDSYVQEEMQNEINEWLEKSVGSKPRLGSETKTNLAENLVAKLVVASKSAANKKKTRTPLSDQENTITQHVRDWLNNNPELSVRNEEENEKVVDELASKLLELRSQGKNDSEIEDEISNWLNTTFEDKGKRLNARNRQKMTDQLLSIINTVSDVPENYHFTPDSWDRQRKYTSKEIERKRWDKQAISQQPISNERASNLDEEYTKTAFGRTEDLRNAVKQGTQPSTSKARTVTEDQLKNNVKHDVGLILDDTNVPYDYGDQVESILTDVLADISMRGEMDTQTKNKLIKALKDLGIPIDQIKQITSKVTDRAKELSMSKEFSNMSNSRNYVTLSPTQKEIFKDSANQEIRDFVQGLTGDRNTLSSQKNRAATEKLVHRVGDIMSRKDTTSADKKIAIENEVSKYLQSLPIGADQSHASELADRLQNQALKMSIPRRSSVGYSKTDYEILSPTQKDIFKDSAIQEIGDFIQELTGDNNAFSSRRNQAATEKLAQRVVDIMSQKDTTIAEKKDDIESEISNYLQSLSVDINQSHASELADILQNQALKMSTPRRSSEGHSITGNETLSPTQKVIFKDRVKQEISDFIQELTDDNTTLSSKKNQAATEKLAQRVGDIMSRKDTTSAEKRDDIENEVSKFLQNLPIGADKSHASELADRITNQAFKTSTPRRSSAGPSRTGYETLSPTEKEMFKDNAKQEICDFIQKLTGDRNTLSSKNNQAATEKLAQRVGDIMSRKDTTSAEKKDDIENEVSKYLQSILVDADPSQASELADRLQYQALKMSTPRRSSEGPSRTGYETLSPMQKGIFKDRAKQEISDFIQELTGDDSTLASQKNQAATEMLAQRVGDIMSRKDTNSAEKRDDIEYEVSQFLQNLPIGADKSHASELTDRLTNQAFNTPTPRRSSAGPSRTGYKTLSPTEKEMFKDYAKQEIGDFIQELTGDRSTLSSKKNQAATERLAQRVGDIMSQTDTTAAEKRDDIESEVSKYLRSISVDADESHASELADRLQSQAFKTSTPKKAIETHSFRPQRDSKDSTISAIEPSSPYKKLALTKEEITYINKLSKVTDDWVSNLPIDLSSEDSKFKDDMVEDLSRDIIDRQKYLQLNPNAKTSDEEELEHLKYQIFRWLNKLSNAKDVMPSMAKAKNFMNRIKSVPVPQLVNFPELVRRPNKRRDSYIQYLSQELTSLENEIQKWIQAVPSKFYANSDENLHQQMVKDLAQLINQLNREDELTEQLFDDAVTDFLQKMLNEYNERYFKTLTEGLKGVLVNKNLISFSNQSLNSLMLDWLKEKAIYQKRPPSERREQEKLMTELSKSLRDTLRAPLPSGEPKDEKMLDKIRATIKRFPMESKLRLNEEFHDSTANDLLEYLKIHLLQNAADLDLTTDASYKSGFKKAADVLYDSVADWCDKLPIDSGITPEENEKVRTLKQNITSKLINKIAYLNVNPEVFRDDILYEELLNDEIDNLISTLPTSPELKEKLTAQKEKLIEKVKEAKAKTQNELAGPAYKEQLRDAISKTLPSKDDTTVEEQTSFEVLKDNVADAYINLRFAAVDEETKRKLKNKISDAINQFCNDYLQRHPSSPVDAKKLNRELYDVLQTVPDPNDETIKSQVELVRTKDEINDWLKGLPLKEDESPIKLLQKNKIVNVLTKRLHDIKKEKEFNPELDVEELLKKETKKWIKKLPIQPGKEKKAEEKIDELINRLGNTEDSRRFSVSDIRHSIDITTERPSQGSIRFSPRTDRPADVPATPTGNKYLSQYVPPFPASTLSTEDRAHLNRIRDRNQPKQAFSQSPVTQPSQYKDVSVNPIPLEAGSQTKVGPSSAKAIQSQITRSQATPSPSADFPPSGQRPGSPEVIVQEHYWGSPDSTMNNVPSGQGQSASYPGQSASYQSQSPLQPQQAPQFSWHQSPVIPPRFEPQPSLGSAPTGMFPSPEQTRMPQTYMPSNTPQQPWSPPPPYMSMPPQPPCVSPPPCMSQSIPCQPFPTQPCPSAAPMPPCMMPKPSPQMHPSNTNPPAPPRIPRSPCMETPQIFQPQIPPCTSQRIPCNRSRRIPPCQFKQTQNRPPCYRSPEISSTSSPFDTGPEMDFRFGPKVTRLGSLDDVPCTKTCGSHSPRAKRSRESPDGDDWNIRFPDEGYWGTPLVRRRVRRSLRNPEAFVKERKEERCRCRERVITKCLGSRPPTSHNYCQPDDDSLNRCSKCCGAHCPHPSYLFFR